MVATLRRGHYLGRVDSWDELTHCTTYQQMVAEQQQHTLDQHSFQCCSSVFVSYSQLVVLLLVLAYIHIHVRVCIALSSHQLQQWYLYNQSTYLYKLMTQKDSTAEKALLICEKQQGLLHVYYSLLLHSRDEHRITFRFQIHDFCMYPLHRSTSMT